MYSSESLSTDCTRLWLFSGRLSNIGIVFIHIHYNIKMYMRTRSPGISKCFIFAHSFYRNYPPLHKTWSDLVLCGLWRPIFFRLLNFPELWVILTKSVTYYSDVFIQTDRIVFWTSYVIPENAPKCAILVNLQLYWLFIAINEYCV